MRNRFFLLTAALLLLFLHAPPLVAQTSSNSSAPYLDPSLPIEQRVNDLVSRMTLQEKASQMQDVAPAIPRLGVPAYNWWNEGLHGVARAGNAAVFPQAHSKRGSTVASRSPAPVNLKPEAFERPLQLRSPQLWLTDTRPAFASSFSTALVRKASR